MYEVIQISHMIFEILHHFVITYLEHKCIAKLKGANLRESKRASKGQGDFSSDRGGGGVLLPKHFDNSLNVYLFLEIEPFS